MKKKFLLLLLLTHVLFCKAGILKDTFPETSIDTITKRIAFYENAGDWVNYSKYKDMEIKGYSADDIVRNWAFINNAAWHNVFLKTGNRAACERAVQWCNLILKHIDVQNTPVAATVIDTKANLLYRIGKVKEAIALEKELLSIAGKKAERERNDLSEMAQEALKKMEKGFPTWP